MKPYLNADVMRAWIHALFPLTSNKKAINHITTAKKSGKFQSTQSTQCNVYKASNPYKFGLN